MTKIQGTMERPLYIFDIDGTLANIEHRLHFIQQDKPDWHAFYQACDKDESNVPVFEVMVRLSAHADIWFFTERPEYVRGKTVNWILDPKQHFGFNIFTGTSLVMRPNGDHTPDDQLKQRFLDNMLEEDRNRLVAVFDDRQRVVDMWRRNSIACFQVAEGNF